LLSSTLEHAKFLPNAEEIIKKEEAKEAKKKAKGKK